MDGFTEVGDVAQLVERRVRNAKVRGSRPLVSTISSHVFIPRLHLEQMSLKNTPELLAFLSTYFPEADPEADGESVRAFLKSSSEPQRSQVLSQARTAATASDLSVEELGIETNRWFGSAEEAGIWLGQLADLLEAGNAESTSGGETPTKDVNGAVLNEGDSVQVIKDLKVRGGSSDLKRGTLVKKIHLIGDPENIECRVDGSTLVLKTCFLKKV